MAPFRSRIDASEVAVFLAHVALVTVIVVAIGTGIFGDPLGRSVGIGVAVGVGFAVAHRIFGFE